MNILKRLFAFEIEDSRKVLNFQRMKLKRKYSGDLVKWWNVSSNRICLYFTWILGTQYTSIFKYSDKYIIHQTNEKKREKLSRYDSQSIYIINPNSTLYRLNVRSLFHCSRNKFRSKSVQTKVKLIFRFLEIIIWRLYNDNYRRYQLVRCP